MAAGLVAVGPVDSGYVRGGAGRTSGRAASRQWISTQSRLLRRPAGRFHICRVQMPENGRRVLESCGRLRCRACARIRKCRRRATTSSTCASVHARESERETGAYRNRQCELRASRKWERLPPARTKARDGRTRASALDIARQSRYNEIGCPTAMRREKSARRLVAGEECSWRKSGCCTMPNADRWGG